MTRPVGRAPALGVRIGATAGAAVAMPGGGGFGTLPAPDRLSSSRIEHRRDRASGGPAVLRPVDIADDAVAMDQRSRMRRAGDETLYVFSTFWLALIAAGLVSLLLVLGVATSVVGIGLLILSLDTGLARTFAAGERSLIRRFLYHPARTPGYRTRADGKRLPDARLKDPQSWLDILHSVLGIIPRTVSFVVTVIWWAGTVGGLSWAVWGWSLWLPDDLTTVPQLIGLPRSYLIDVIFYALVGAVFAVTLPLVTRAMAWLSAGPALLALSSRALQQEVQNLTEGRSAARTAEADSLRRLERDIHDGPQQRLVRLSMDLGRVRKQIASDPAKAADSLEEAIIQTRATLDELRALSRGIAPPVLSDRGLEAAMEEIIARSTVPVHLTMDVPDDLPDHVETAAYFVVSEALTNVAKHSMATYALVDLSYEQKVLTVKVSDDGVGGAQLAKGRGLVGLSDRVRGVDGVLNVTSPPGGPTELTAEISCVS